MVEPAAERDQGIAQIARRDIVVDEIGELALTIDRHHVDGGAAEYLGAALVAGRPLVRMQLLAQRRQQPVLVADAGFQRGDLRPEMLYDAVAPGHLPSSGRPVRDAYYRAIFAAGQWVAGAFDQPLIA